MFLLEKKLRPALGKDVRTEADQGLSVIPNACSTDFPRPVASLLGRSSQVAQGRSGDPSQFHGYSTARVFGEGS
jgi:hypothetical protein